LEKFDGLFYRCNFLRHEHSNFTNYSERFVCLRMWYSYQWVFNSLVWSRIREVKGTRSCLRFLQFWDLSAWRGTHAYTYTYMCTCANARAMSSKTFRLHLTPFPAHSSQRNDMAKRCFTWNSRLAFEDVVRRARRILFFFIALFLAQDMEVTSDLLPATSQKGAPFQSTVFAILLPKIPF